MEGVKKRKRLSRLGGAGGGGDSLVTEPSVVNPRSSLVASSKPVENEEAEVLCFEREKERGRGGGLKAAASRWALQTAGEGEVEDGHGEEGETAEASRWRSFPSSCRSSRFTRGALVPREHPRAVSCR